MIYHNNKEVVAGKVLGIIRDIDSDEVLVELKFENKPIEVYMPKSMFNTIDDIYVGLEIEYIILKEDSKLKEVIKLSERKQTVTPNIIKLRKKIFDLLDWDNSDTNNK